MDSFTSEYLRARKTLRQQKATSSGAEVPKAPVLQDPFSSFKKFHANRETALAQQSQPKVGTIKVPSRDYTQNKNYAPTFQKYFDAAKQDNVSFSPIKLGSGIVEQGLVDSAKVVTSTLSFAEGLITRPIDYIVTGFKDDETPLTDSGVLHRLNEHFAKLKEETQQKYAGNIAAGGAAAQVVNDLGSSAVAAIPQAVLAMLTFGGSAAATGLGAASKAAQAAPGIATSVQTVISQAPKNPMFWSTFLQTTGNEYEEAKARGASELAASLEALTAGTINSMVEIGGGIEALPAELQGGKFTVRKWVESMLDEGKEEVVQGIVSRGLQTLAAQDSAPLFSLSDQDAVLNPLTSAQEFAGGVVVGGLLGGAQGLTANFISGRATNAELNSIGSQVLEGEGLGQLVETAKQLSPESDGYKRAVSLEQRVSDGKSVTNLQVGQLYQSVAQEILAVSDRVKQAVDKAQTAPYNEKVETEAETVVNRGTTLYTQLGMKLKKAESKAAVVQKLIDGKDVSLDELKSLNLSDPQYQKVFSDLTGVEFPSGTLTDEQRYNLARSSSDLATIQNRSGAPTSRTATEATPAGTGAAVFTPSVTSGVANTPDTLASQTVRETESQPNTPGSGVADLAGQVPSLETFSEAYRSQVDPDATESQLREQYDKYVADMQTFRTSSGQVITRAEFRQIMRNGAQGKRYSDEQLNQVFDAAVNQQAGNSDARPLFRPGDGGGLAQYKSSESYKLNAALRAGEELTPEQEQQVKDLDADLDEAPVYTGTVYRNISFDLDGPEALQSFLDTYVPGTQVIDPAYTSTSKSPTGYVVEGELVVHMTIAGKTGRDVSNQFGLPEEQEVLFPRGTAFNILFVQKMDDGYHLILEEANVSGQRDSGGAQEVLEGVSGDRTQAGARVEDRGQDDTRGAASRAGTAGAVETRDAGAARGEVTAEAETDLARMQQMAWGEQVSQRNSLPDNSALYLRETPYLLSEVGLGDLPMCMTVKHLNDVMHEKSTENARWHGISEDVIRRLPELISKPAMIMDSNSRRGDILIVTTEVDADGNPVVVSVRPNGTARVGGVLGPANFITSVYGRENFAVKRGRNSLNNLMYLATKNRLVLYWSKQKTEALFREAGLQLPNAFNSVPSETILRQHAGYVKENIPERLFRVEEGNDEVLLSDDSRREGGVQETGSRADGQVSERGLGDRNRPRRSNADDSVQLVREGAGARSGQEAASVGEKVAGDQRVGRAYAEKGESAYDRRTGRGMDSDAVAQGPQRKSVRERTTSTSPEGVRETIPLVGDRRIQSGITATEQNREATTADTQDGASFVLDLPDFKSWDDAFLHLGQAALGLELGEPPFLAAMSGEMDLGYSDPDGNWVTVQSFDLTPEGLMEFKRSLPFLLQSGALQPQARPWAETVQTGKAAYPMRDGSTVEVTTVSAADAGLAKAEKDASRVGMQLVPVLGSLPGDNPPVGVTIARTRQIFTTAEDPELGVNRRTADHEVLHAYALADHELQFQILDAIRAAGLDSEFDILYARAASLWGDRYAEADPVTLQYQIEQEVMAEARAGNADLLGRGIKKIGPTVRKAVRAWEKNWDTMHKGTNPQDVWLRQPNAMDLALRYRERGGFRDSTPDPGEGIDFSMLDETDAYDRYALSETQGQKQFRTEYDAIYGEGAAAELLADVKNALAAAQAREPAEGEQFGWAVYGQESETQSVGAAALRFDPYSYLQNEYGTIPQTGTNYRMVDVPKSTTGRDKVMKTASTVMGAEATPEARLGTIAQAVVDGKLSYVPITNKILNNQTRAKIRKQGYNAVLSDWTRQVEQGRVNAKIVATGATLLNNAGNSDMDGRTYTELLVDYANVLHRAGQALQAARLLKTLSPEAKLYEVIREVDRVNRKAFPDANVPVEQWMDRAGGLLADQLADRVSTKQGKEKARTVVDTILDDLFRRASEMVERPPAAAKKVRTEMERLQDMFDNYENYKEAWEAAKETIRSEYKDDPGVLDALDDWLNSSLDLAKPLTQELIRGSQVTMSEELAEKYLAAKTDGERESVMDEILQDIADQIPSTWGDKLTAWRYLAMLGNFRTQVRNVLGNTFMQPLRMTKETFAGLTEAMLQRSGVKIQRTTSALYDLDTFKEAFQDYNEVRDIILSGGKYDDSRKYSSEIESKRRIYKNALLEGYRKATNKAMDMGDSIFCSFTYADSLSRFMKANGTTWSQADEALKDKARSKAIRDAAEATYRDNNALSELVSRLRIRDPKTTLAKAAQVLIEGTLPFRKTPANILVRAYEYSPLGILDTAYKTVRAVKGSDEVSANDIIDSAAKTLTGTGLVALGFAWAAMGALKGKAPDDEKEKELWEMQGHQAYSLEVDGRSYTLDWLAPSSIPMFFGANLQEAMLGKGLTVDEATEAFGSLFDPILEMSMLQGINDLIESSANYGTVAAAIRLPANAAWNYLTQFVPTVVGQAARAMEPERMTTYADRNNAVPDDLERKVGNLSGKIPGWDYARITYIDPWGRTEPNADTATLNALNQFFSPGYYSKIRETDMEKELLRLYQETGEKGVLLSAASKYLTVDKERKDLTADEYLTYAVTRGQTAFSVVTELVESESYNVLTDEQKVKAVEKIFSYADQTAKEVLLGDDFAADKWVYEVGELSDLGISPADYAVANAAISEVSGIKDKDGKTVSTSKALRSMQTLYRLPGVNEDNIEVLAEYLGVAESVRKYSSKMVQRKLEAMEKKYQKYNE